MSGVKPYASSNCLMVTGRSVSWPYLWSGVSTADTQRAEQSKHLPSRHLGYLDSPPASLPRSRRHQPRPALHRSWYRHIRNLFGRCRLDQLWSWCAAHIPIMTGLWGDCAGMLICWNVRTRTETRRVKHFLEIHQRSSRRGARSRAMRFKLLVGALYLCQYIRQRGTVRTFLPLFPHSEGPTATFPFLATAQNAAAVPHPANSI